MIRWYDYTAAVLAADIMITAFFNLNFIGGVVAWIVYELWMNVYCQYRLEQEWKR